MLFQLTFQLTIKLQYKLMKPLKLQLKLPNKNKNELLKASCDKVKLSINLFKYLSNKIITNN